MMVFEDLKDLANVKGPCLSIFQPVRDEFSQVAKSDTRLAAAARKASSLLTEQGLTDSAKDEFLSPVFKLAANTDWSSRTGSMVIFRAPDFTKAIFWPDSFEARVHLGHEFLILPLLAGIEAQRDFWLLSLSINRIRLFRGIGGQFSETDLPKDLPRSLSEAGAFDRPDHDQENRWFPGASNGQIAAVRSGTSSANETKGRYLHDFFRMINRSIQPILAGSGDSLIVAAVTRELAIYREVNTYSLLLEQAIQGSPEALGEEWLRKKALELLTVRTAQAGEDVRRDMEAAAGRGLLLTDRAAIVEAARQAQIAHLFLDANALGANDAANRAALAVISHGGKVVCEAPYNNQEMAAILRYRVAEVPVLEPAGSRI